MQKGFTASVAIMIATATAAFAVTLPSDATELSPAEVKAMYEGKTSDWKSVRVFFAPDGSAKMVRKDKKAYGEGRWTVAGNKMCLSINAIQVSDKKNRTVDDCYSWFKSGSKHFMRWSGDEAKADAYRDDEPARLAKGDLVSKDHAALAK